jgi:hypothetical protein
MGILRLSVSVADYVRPTVSAMHRYQPDAVPTASSFVGIVCHVIFFFFFFLKFFKIYFRL